MSYLSHKANYKQVRGLGGSYNLVKDITHTLQF